MARGLYVSPDQFVAFAEPRQRLTDHIATRDRSPDFTALGLYLPNPDPILKKLGRDLAVYRELRSDAHVGGCVRRRKAAIKALEWRIERDQASARATRMVKAVFDGLDMDRLLSEIMEAPLYGWHPLELIWSPGRPILPRQVIGKPPEWFLFDTEARLRFRSRANPLYGEETAPRKFLVPTQDASYANPYGFPDLSMCFWPTTFKRGGLKFWVKFAEKYGMPYLVGKQPRNTPAGETDRLLDQLEAMIEDAVAVIPDDASVDIVGSDGTGTSAEAYERLLMFCRSEVSIALLGQNQSTEASATNASAKAGLEVTASLRDGDKRLVEAACNQLARWVVDLNEGEQAPAPRFEMWEELEVNKAQAERDEILTRAGLRFTPVYWKRTYDLEDGDLESAPEGPSVPGGRATPPVATDAGVITPVTRVTNPPGAAFAEANPPAAPPDALDALVDAAMSDWAPLVKPLTDPIATALQEAAARGETAAQVIARLPALLAEMDSGPLTERLTRATYQARLAAQAGLNEDGQRDAPPADSGATP